MKGLIATLLVALFAAAVISEDAQAARLGGGRSLGAKRIGATPLRQAGVPSQQQPAPAATQAAGARWLAPLAALVAGFSLGWLFSQGGLEGIVLTALLIAAATFALARRLGRSRAAATQSAYAGLGNETVVAPPPSQFLDGDTVQPDYRSQFVASVPPGFDLEGFLKEAKRNFLRLQEASDRGDLRRLRQVTTSEMFDALKDGVAGTPPARETHVVTLAASLVELITEAGLHWASVRFSGSIREDPRETARPFAEIWHLQKPVDGSSGWLLAGIQQPG